MKACRLNMIFSTNHAGLKLPLGRDRYLLALKEVIVFWGPFNSRDAPFQD